MSTLVDGSFGPVANRRKGLQSQVKRANQRIEGMERRVELKEKRLRQKFAKLEEKMAGLKAQGGMIAAKFGGSGETGLNFGGGSFG